MIYHFTDNQAAIQIILSSYFRFSRYSELDDPVERTKARSFSGTSDATTYFDTFQKLYEAFSVLVNNTNVGCFFDQVDESGKNASPLDNLKMWSHYGNWNKGSCLVLDKEKTIERFEEYGLNVKRDSGRVFYDLDFRRDFNMKIVPGMDIDASSIDLYESRFADLFFLKSKHFQGENEYRFAIRGGATPFQLPVVGLISQVVLAENCSTDEQNMIVELCKLKGISVWRMVMTDTELLKVLL